MWLNLNLSKVHPCHVWAVLTNCKVAASVLTQRLRNLPGEKRHPGRAQQTSKRADLDLVSAVWATRSWAREASSHSLALGPAHFPLAPPPPPTRRVCLQFWAEGPRAGSKNGKICSLQAVWPWVIRILFWPRLMDWNAKKRAGAPCFLGGHLWLQTSRLRTSEIPLAAAPLWLREAAAGPFAQLSRSKGLGRGCSWREPGQEESSGHSVSWRDLLGAHKGTLVKVRPGSG